MRMSMGAMRRRSGGGYSRRVVGLVAASALALSACGGGGEEAEGETASENSGVEAEGDPVEVTAVLDAPLTTMNPLFDPSTGQAFFNTVFDTLIGQAEEGEPAPPRLAESWETEDGALWTFHLVEGVTFHDGSPLTAEDVVFTLETIMEDPENPFNSRFLSVESVTAVDDTTVEFQLAEPSSAFPGLLVTISIVPSDYYAEVGKDGFADKPIGSGPFVLKESRTDQIVLEAYDDYFAGRSEIDTLTWQVVESATSAIAALEAGDVDVVGDIPPGEAARLDAIDGINVESIASRLAIFLGYNVNVAPLDDPDIRRAIDLAIDREAIVDGLVYGEAVPLGQPAPKAAHGHDPDIQATAFDPEAAAELVEGSGYDGTEITMYYPTSRIASGDQIAQAIVSYLAEVGLNVRAEPLEWATLLQNWVGTSIDGMYMFSYINGADAETIIASIYQEDSRNYFDDQEIFDLVRAQQAEPDVDARLELLSELWHLSNEKQYYTWLYSPNALFGIREGVPVEPSSTGRIWID